MSNEVKQSSSLFYAMVIVFCCWCLAASANPAWQNPALKQDVNKDGCVNNNDATAVTGFLAGSPSKNVPTTRPPGEPFFDVSGDGIVTSLDALQISNAMGEQGGSFCCVPSSTGATSSWTNPKGELDVNDDGVINGLDRDAVDTEFSGVEHVLSPANKPPPKPFFDVTGDGSISQADFDSVKTVVDTYPNGIDICNTPVSLCGNGTVDAGEQCDGGSGCESNCTFSPADYHSQIVVSSKPADLGKIIPSAATGGTIDSVLQVLYGDAVDRSGSFTRISATTLKNVVVLHAFVRDANGTGASARIRWDVKSSGARAVNRPCTVTTVGSEVIFDSATSDPVCVLGYKYGDQPVKLATQVLDDDGDAVVIPNSGNHNGTPTYTIGTNFGSSPVATLILVNVSGNVQEIKKNDLEIKVGSPSGGNLSAQPLVEDIEILPEGQASCRIAVSGATGDVFSKDCGNNSDCVADTVTATENRTLAFQATVEGVPAHLSDPSSVVWSDSASNIDANGKGDFDVSVTTDIKATVNLRNGATVYCAVRVLPEGRKFFGSVIYGGSCPLFYGLHDYYLTDADGNAQRGAIPGLNDDGDAINGIKFPGLNKIYGGPLPSLPAGTPGAEPTGQVPIQGAYNAGMEADGFLGVGTGGKVVLPAPSNRRFVAPVIVATRFNTDVAENGSQFGDPTAFGVVDLSSAPNEVVFQMVPQLDNNGEPQRNPDGSFILQDPPADDEFVIVRMFVARSYYDAAAGVERRGMGGQSGFMWEFLPGGKKPDGSVCEDGDTRSCPDGDMWVPLMEESCIPLFQVVPPVRTDKQMPKELANTRLCMNSRPYKWGDLVNGRVKIKALQVAPNAPNEDFPTSLLRSSVHGPGGVCESTTGEEMVPCWNVTFGDLPSNISDVAKANHSQCSKVITINVQQYWQDNYGNYHYYTVPQQVTVYEPNCVVPERAADRCSSQVAVRFAANTMLQTAALMCANKYDEEVATYQARTSDPDVAGKLRDMNGIAVSPTLARQGMIPYTTQFGGRTPAPFSGYPMSTIGGNQGIGCIPCRFGEFVQTTNPALPTYVDKIPPGPATDNTPRHPIYTFTKSKAPRSCVETQLDGGGLRGNRFDVRYFGGELCGPGANPEVVSSQVCSSGNIPSSTSCVGSNVAATSVVPICPGSGLNYTNVAVSWSPLLLDVADQMIRVSRTFASAVYFDMNGDGTKILVDWPLNTEEAGFLVIPDKDGNVTSIRQLFGDYRAKNGFESLKKYDSNNDGFIDEADRSFSKFRLWFDRNRNGLSDDGELVALQKHKVTKIGLFYRKPGGPGIEGKTLKSYYWNSKEKKYRVIADVYFYQYQKNGMPIVANTKRDLASKKQ